MVSSIFWSKLSGNPYGTGVSNVRPDFSTPYNNYGYGYNQGYQGYQQGYSTVYSRPLHVFGKFESLNKISKFFMNFFFKI